MKISTEFILLKWCETAEVAERQQINKIYDIYEVSVNVGGWRKSRCAHTGGFQFEVFRCPTCKAAELTKKYIKKQWRLQARLRKRAKHVDDFRFFFYAISKNRCDPPIGPANPTCLHQIVHESFNWEDMDFTEDGCAALSFHIAPAVLPESTSLCEQLKIKLAVWMTVSLICRDPKAATAMKLTWWWRGGSSQFRLKLLHVSRHVISDIFFPFYHLWIF